MAEGLQTACAILDLLKLTYQAGVFLKKVKDAGQLAAEISERIERLRNVLEGVSHVLHNRNEDAKSAQDLHVIEEIRHTVLASSKTLNDLGGRVGGFEEATESDGNGRVKLIERFKIAMRHPSIVRISRDLEARIQILSTNLSILQIFEQRENHLQLRHMIEDLTSRVNKGNDFKHYLISTRAVTDSFENVDCETMEDDAVPTDLDDEVLESLTKNLKIAEDVLTSEHIPDNRSEVAAEEIIDAVDSHSIQGVMTPPSRQSPSPFELEIEVDPDQETAFHISEEEDDEQDEDVWPLEILSQNIDGHAERAAKEAEAEHFEQAEMHLTQAIRYAEKREMRYAVQFDTQIQWQEQMAWLLQKQGKWAEAVATVFRLLRERAPSVAEGAIPAEKTFIQARCNQLLGSIYYDRHVSSGGLALSNATEDIDNAETYAKRAFNKRWKLLETSAASPDEVKKHSSCTQLLVQILETRDKIVEANQLKKYLSEHAWPVDDDLHRIATIPREDTTGSDSVPEKHELLVEAIKAGNTEEIQNLLTAPLLNLEWKCRDGKTPLMHAIEQADQQTVNKLLDPEVGADVNTANRDGLTALHIAAVCGQHQLAKCLIKHGAVIESRDNKGQSPMIKAVQAGDRAMVQVLFDADDQTMQARGREEWCLLHYSVRGMYQEMTRLLLNLWPELRHAVDTAGKTALHHSVELERLEQAVVLLEHKNAIDVDAVDSVSRTALYLVASKPANERRRRIVSLLISHGASVDESRPPLRRRDYSQLRKPLRRRASDISRTSVSTSGTIGTDSSSGWSRLTRKLSRRSCS